MPEDQAVTMDASARRRATMQGLKIFLACLPVYIVVSLFGGPGERFAAAVSAGMLVAAAIFLWRFHVHVWFWLTLAALATIQALMTLRLPWQWTDRLSGPELRPLGMAELLFDVCCLELVAWLAGGRAGRELDAAREWRRRLPGQRAPADQRGGCDRCLARVRARLGRAFGGWSGAPRRVMGVSPRPNRVSVWA